MSSIFSALRDNNLSLLDELLTQGANVNQTDHWYRTVLHFACKDRNLKAVELRNS